MWPWTRSTSSPASTASSMSRRISAGVASASPTRVGSRLAPFRNSRSPLTEHTHSFQATSRSPVRRFRRSLNSPSTITSIDISVNGWSPSERGHHSAGFSMSRFQLTSLRPPASDRSDSAIGRPSIERADADAAAVVAVEAGVEEHVRPRRVGVAAQHTEPIDANRAGVVEAHRPPEAAGVPVAVDAVPVLEHAGDVALVAGAALRRARHLDGEHVLVAESRQRGDVERVRDEVALGVAEVGAVEEHVGLVEDAVERHPPPVVGVGLRRREPMAVEQRTIAAGELGIVPPVPRDLDRLPRAVIGVEADRPSPHVVVGLGRAPDPRELH